MTLDTKRQIEILLSNYKLSTGKIKLWVLMTEVVDKQGKRGAYLFISGTCDSKH